MKLTKKIAIEIAGEVREFYVSQDKENFTIETLTSLKLNTEKEQSKVEVRVNQLNHQMRMSWLQQSATAIIHQQHVSVGGDDFAFEAISPLKLALLHEFAGGPSGGALKAPISGKVIKVLVQEGDVVEAQTPVVILEAMKMENEISAGAAGKVSHLKIEVGQQLEVGAPMMQFDSEKPDE
jgi:biotin carboxyl carrier protein